MVAVGATAEDAAPAGAAAPADKGAQLKQLNAQLDARERELRKALAGDATLAPLKAARDEASQAYEEARKKAHEGATPEAQAIKDAQAKLKGLLDAKLGANANVQAAKAKADELDKRKADLAAQAAAAKGDAEKTAKAALRDCEKEVSAAAKALRLAQDAAAGELKKSDADVKAAYEAISKAEKALDASAPVAEARKAFDTARQPYEKAYNEKLMADPAYAKLKADGDALKKSLDEEKKAQKKAK